MNDNRIAYKAITFDDVLLEPGFSDVVPKDVDVRTQVTRNIRINIPIVSSPMDTVTESELAIALAQEGGFGIIHKNMTVPQQTREVDKVKRSENGIIVDPITLPPDETVGTARRIMEQQNISGVPITVKGYLKGILTRRDLRFLTDNSQRLSEVMTKENLVTAAENTTLEDAERLLTENKVEKLLLVDDEYRLKGLITIKDIDKQLTFPNACKDARGRLRVGAATGVHDYERAESLIRAGVDVLVVDSAHGHTRNVIETGRCREGRHRSGVDLHHASNFRRGRTANHRGDGGGPRRGRNRCPAHCRRRHPLFRRHDESHRGRRSLRDDRRTVCRAGGKSGANDSVQGSQLQDLPWHGFARGHGVRLGRSL
jgi:IMP dehydrogenase